MRSSPVGDHETWPPRSRKTVNRTLWADDHCSPPDARTRAPRVMTRHTTVRTDMAWLRNGAATQPASEGMLDRSDDPRTISYGGLGLQGATTSEPADTAAGRSRAPVAPPGVCTDHLMPNCRCFRPQNP